MSNCTTDPAILCAERTGYGPGQKQEEVERHYPITKSCDMDKSNRFYKLKKKLESIKMSENTITVYDKFEQNIQKFEAADAEKKFDVSTSEGEKECSDYCKALRKIYNRVDDVRVFSGAEALQKQRDVNAEAKKIFARIDAMEKPRKALLKAKAAQEQLKIDKIAAANKLKAEIEDAEREAYLEKGERELEADKKELQDKVDAIQAEEVRQTNERHIAEAAEQARIDEKAKAKQDAKDAAELAERNQKEAVAKAEQEALDKAAKILSDRVKAENEQKAEDARLAQVEADRVANVQHREDVEKAIISQLDQYVEDRSISSMIVKAIKAGKISTLSIQY